jgi:superfamily II DNA or RNA helicase
MKVLKRSGLLIPREYKDRDFYKRIKEKLTRRNKAYQYSHATTYTFFEESEKFLLVPRYFPLQEYGYFEYENHQHEGIPISIEHHIEPRNEQQMAAMDYMVNFDKGIIQLSPGVGKTVISIYMIAERKLKSAIFVHRDALADQWRERFLQFTNLKNDDIARVRSSSFQDDLDKPITIFTVQTFKSLLTRYKKEFLTKLHESNIGIFIGDEVHTTVGAPTFSECSIHMPSKYTYGLSATPYRWDGNGDIIEYHLGKVYTGQSSADTMKPKVTVLLLDYQIDTPYRAKYIHWDGEFQRARYLNLIKKSKPFLLSIKGLLARLKNDRNMIIMAERIKLIDELYKWLNHDSKGNFSGSAKSDQLDYQITFTTPGKCRDGVDAPWKDCLIMTSPISNVEQAIGRIIRTKEDKKEPIVIDMVDYGCKRIANTFRSRLNYYKDKEYEIRYLLFKDKVLREIDEINAMNMIRSGV